MTGVILPRLLASRMIRSAGRLYGTTEQPPSPGGTGSSEPMPRSVVHIFERDFQSAAFFTGADLVEAVRSDASGNWVSPLVHSDRSYAAIAYDPTGKYDPVVKTNLIPDPL